MSEAFWELCRLRGGTPAQREAVQVLRPIFEVLNEFDPRLAGTVPLEVEVAGSDLDVLCCARDLGRFARCASRVFGSHQEFELWRGAVVDEETVICRFVLAHWPVEVFAQRTIVERQVAFRHLCVEWRLLQLGGDRLRARVRDLKLAGLGTEPAFAKVLGLEGDAYEAVLRLGGASEEQLALLVDAAGFSAQSVGSR